MSLDIYLYSNKTLTCDCGKVHEVETYKCVYDSNITHNLGAMAKEAGIYDALWSPNEAGIKRAKQLSDIIIPAIIDMVLRPDHYRKFDSSNKWGVYEDFVPWLENLRDACVKYPNATIKISK